MIDEIQSLLGCRVRVVDELPEGDKPVVLPKQIEFLKLMLEKGGAPVFYGTIPSVVNPKNVVILREGEK